MDLPEVEPETLAPEADLRDEDETREAPSRARTTRADETVPPVRLVGRWVVEPRPDDVRAEAASPLPRRLSDEAVSRRPAAVSLPAWVDLRDVPCPELRRDRLWSSDPVPLEAFLVAGLRLGLEASLSASPPWEPGASTCPSPIRADLAGTCSGSRCRSVSENLFERMKSST